MSMVELALGGYATNGATTQDPLNDLSQSHQVLQGHSTSPSFFFGPELLMGIVKLKVILFSIFFTSIYMNDI